MLPPTIPLFPLPNVVLFPNVCLPLHIFEPRYREMVADALDGDRIIGMVLLRPGWEGEYEGRPPIYDVGCAGLITHAERTDDGRYNLVLRGLQKFKVQEEDHSPPLPHRGDRADPRTGRRTRPRDRSPPSAGGSRRCSCRSRHGRGVDPKMPPSMPDEELVNALAQYLDLEVGREAGAARTRRPGAALPLADRTARNEGDRRAPQVGRGELLIAIADC